MILYQGDYRWSQDEDLFLSVGFDAEDRIAALEVTFGHGEYGVFAHLRRHSVLVRAGQQVKAGDVLGLCGNSGNSSEPHLHFHLQDRPDLFDALGLPVTFVDYISNGQPVTEGTPVQGELLRLPTE